MRLCCCGWSYQRRSDDGDTTWSLTDRWPTAFGLFLAAGAIAAIVLLDEDGDRFYPGVATMAGTVVDVPVGTALLISAIAD